MKKYFLNGTSITVVVKKCIAQGGTWKASASLYPKADSISVFRTSLGTPTINPTNKSFIISAFC